MNNRIKIIIGVSVAILIITAIVLTIVFTTGDDDDSGDNGNDNNNAAGFNTATTSGGNTATTLGGYTATTPGGNTATTSGGNTPTTSGGNTPTTPGGYTATTSGGNTPTTPGGYTATTSGGNTPTTSGGNTHTERSINMNRIVGVLNIANIQPLPSSETFSNGNHFSYNQDRILRFFNNYVPFLRNVIIRANNDSVPVVQANMGTGYTKTIRFIQDSPIRVRYTYNGSSNGNHAIEGPIIKPKLNAIYKGISEDYVKSKILLNHTSVTSLGIFISYIIGLTYSQEAGLLSYQDIKYKIVKGEIYLIKLSPLCGCNKYFRANMNEISFSNKGLLILPCCKFVNISMIYTKWVSLNISTDDLNDQVKKQTAMNIINAIDGILV